MLFGLSVPQIHGHGYSSPGRVPGSLLLKGSLLLFSECDQEEAIDVVVSLREAVLATLIRGADVCLEPIALVTSIVMFSRGGVQKAGIISSGGFPLCTYLPSNHK
mmetsp:Transcript_5169/g.10460  ORF Transcript_5169/g.10460 Transcript_5169/m.10460 type:complete len:105 (-) Transcript_5169:326-640(-)